MGVPWPSGVEIKLQRAGYTRTPEDVVQRLAPDTGPALLRLLAGTRRQRIQGNLRLAPGPAAVFRAWRGETLRAGSRFFDWVITDSGANVEARLTGQPVETELSGRSVLFALEIETVAAPASPARMSMLAALDGLGAADWPAGLPFHPLRGAFQDAPTDRVVRGSERGLSRQVAGTLGEGREVTAALRFSRAGVATFEAWFETTLALGVRPARVPLRGALHTAFFNGAYTVAPGLGEDFVVTCPLYLEALA